MKQCPRATLIFAYHRIARVVVHYRAGCSFLSHNKAALIRATLRYKRWSVIQNKTASVNNLWCMWLVLHGWHRAFIIEVNMSFLDGRNWDLLALALVTLQLRLEILLRFLLGLCCLDDGSYLSRLPRCIWIRRSLLWRVARFWLSRWLQSFWAFDWGAFLDGYFFGWGWESLFLLQCEQSGDVFRGFVTVMVVVSHLFDGFIGAKLNWGDFFLGIELPHE